MTDGREPSAGRSRRADARTIRALRWVVDLVMLAATVYAVTVAWWLGVGVFVLWRLFATAIPVAVLSPLFGARRVQVALWDPLVLEPRRDADALGPPRQLVGREGEAATALAPEGFVTIDGERLPARCDDDFLEAGDAVVVVGTRLETLLVAPRDAS